MRINLALATSLLALALPSAASGRAGDPDPAFGLGGEAVVALGGGEPVLAGLATAPDGSIVVAAGDFLPFSGDREVLMRFTKGGRLDTRFGSGGIVDLHGLYLNAAPVVEPDGGVLVAGSVPLIGGTEFAVARFGRGGAPDHGFGDGGVTVVPFRSDSYATGVGRDALGRVVAGGTASADFAVARLTPAGALDPAFGDGGMARSASPISSRALAMTIDDAGRAVLAGDGMEVDADGQTRQVPLLARFTDQGRLDDGFGSGGIARLPVEQGSTSQVLVQPDGDLVVTARGSVKVPLFRYRPDGTLDPSFGVGGDATISRRGVSYGLALARQPDGKLLVTATDGIEKIIGGWALSRVRPDGSLDRSFGDRGIFTTARGADYWFPAGVAVQPHGGIVVGGVSMSCGNRVISLIRVKAGAGGSAAGAPAIRGCDPRASKSGATVRAIVDCPLLAPVCKGRVALRHRGVRIGEGRFDLRGYHRYALVRIRSHGAAKRLLARSTRLPATATYRVKGANGRERTVVRHVTVKR